MPRESSIVHAWADSKNGAQVTMKETGRTPKEHRKIPIFGDPPILDMKPPSTASEHLRAKQRASLLITKFSGPHWREAQRTKWILDLVMHIDNEYKGHFMEHEQTIETLHQQLQHSYDLNKAAQEELLNQMEELREAARLSEAKALESAAHAHDCEVRVQSMEHLLEAAEDAATLAAEQCEELKKSVRSVAIVNSTRQKALAHAHHELRGVVVSGAARLRAAREAERRTRLEAEARVRLCQVKAEEDRLQLSAGCDARVKAVKEVTDAAARLRLDRLELELSAYKEPWAYIHRDRSPTRDKKVTKTLKLKDPPMGYRPAIAYF